jgi:peroxiredoxin
MSPTFGTSVCEFGWNAPNFTGLKGTDGRSYSLADGQGPNGALILFLCNHCPYVKAIADRIVRDVRDLQGKGVGAIAIMSNDSTEYAEDSFDNMKHFAAANGFTFPYVWDETQNVGHAYNAQCTPEFFGFNANLELQYHGRLDSSTNRPAEPGVRRELFEAMSQVAETGQGPRKQTASIGCSIKWRKG